MTFEESLEKLNNIKDQLDSPDITLDASIELYKQSIDHTKNCIDLLKSTEGKIVVIKKEIDGILEKPLDIKED